jgi:hypothetical protein
MNAHYMRVYKYLGQVSTGYDGRWLIVDANLEAGGAPVHKLNGTFGLDGGDSGIDILWYNVATVKHAASHVLAMSRIAFDHLIGRLETSIRDLGDRQLFVVGLLSGNNRGVGD